MVDASGGDAGFLGAVFGVPVAVRELAWPLLDAEQAIPLVEVEIKEVCRIVAVGVELVIGIFPGEEAFSPSADAMGGAAIDVPVAHVECFGVCENVFTDGEESGDVHRFAMAVVARALARFLGTALPICLTIWVLLPVNW